ncbi:Gfo/Idh/MocA family oxidoreductase [Metasolibacillus sp.]|uniref:Gfo/Idh/MocA family protein n=1 Tax=Metasolibacillus sp. TaxID=2703680 RepID=UPI0025ECCFE4|nr:Gfo/Idh/MocA family oxidoreductase [Metasolibacillus sp.]MCT6924755.1 Gfo/Idh/MocA family oxidoreductase [Metasolibacillus sp.]MCT6940892.1 Gfo/Idh/MocA family oxidoreductase [Metasolibacillus sp.]
MTKTTFALIGTGIVGERIINQILAHPYAEIVAIFDGNQTRLQEIADKYNIPAVATLEELLATKPDWVYIGTPPVSHAPLAKEIAAHGLHILSEKPLAHDAQDGIEMVQVAEEAGVKTAMHFPLMYSPAVHEMKQRLANQELGEIVRIELHTYFPEWPRKWQQNPWIASREQGGFIREVFPHYLQLMHHFFGDITILSHETTYPEDVTLCETGVSALAKTENGVPVVLNGLSSIGQEERLEFKVFGTEKVMTLRNWSELWLSAAYEEAQHVTPSIEPASLLDACRAHLQDEDALIVSFEEGLKVQKWIDELLK